MSPAQIHSLNGHLLNICFMPGTVLDINGKDVNEAQHTSPHGWASILRTGDKETHTYLMCLMMSCIMEKNSI